VGRAREAPQQRGYQSRTRAGLEGSDEGWRQSTIAFPSNCLFFGGRAERNEQGALGRVWLAVRQNAVQPSGLPFVEPAFSSIFGRHGKTPRHDLAARPRSTTR
jgi:hypothetical protein